MASAHLAESALHPAQKVIVAGPDAVSAVDVVDFKSQLLNLLKVVVPWENLGEDRVQVALDHFCPVQLREDTDFCLIYLKYVIFDYFNSLK